VLCDRVSVQGYEKSQGDILAVSEMAGDIQDTLLEYQVGSGKLHAAVVSLNLDPLTDDPATGNI
jgi:hypothetical protein